MTLKYENTAQIGDTIKAFDHEPFEGRRDRYVVGEVVAKGDGPLADESEFFGFSAYVIRVTEDATFDGDYTRVGLEVLVPFETDMDYEGRVTKVA